MSRDRILSGGGFASGLRAVSADDAETVIKSVEAYIRTQGATHRQLAELAGIDPATFQLFMMRKMPADWEMIARKIDEVIAGLRDRLQREAKMPVMTPVVKETIGMVRLLLADGGIGLIQGDSGTGKTEAANAVALRHERAIVIQASTARARPKPMLEDIGQRMGISYYSKDTADTYKAVRERLPAFDLLIVDEAHKYISDANCLHVLADLVKETGVPQLWTATGDLRRYLDRRISQWRDPFAQIRSRISHTIDLADAGGAVIRPDDVRELASRKFGLKLDSAAARGLCDLASLDNEGSLRLVENTLKHVKRLATAGKLETVDARLIALAMDRSVSSKRTRERVRRVAASAKPTETPDQQQGGLRATA